MRRPINACNQMEKLGLSNGSDAHGEIQGQNWTTGETVISKARMLRLRSSKTSQETPPNGRSV